jgi:hypothetical protein
VFASRAHAYLLLNSGLLTAKNLCHDNSNDRSRTFCYVVTFTVTMALRNNGFHDNQLGNYAGSVLIPC